MYRKEIPLRYGKELCFLVLFEGFTYMADREVIPSCSIRFFLIVAGTPDELFL